MASLKTIELPPGLDALPPTEDELPYSDGAPMESEQHLLQMNLLIETLRLHWKDRPRGYVGGNMAVYFSQEQVQNRDFRAPDFYAVVNGVKRLRKSWVLWQEGRGPDVVVELLSESTEAVDRGEKKQAYQDELRVPEYFWYEPFGGELAGFRLAGGRYKPIRPDKQGRLRSERLGLLLVRQDGSYQGVEAPWLRWMTDEGHLLPTQQEAADQESQRADQESRRADQESRRAEQESRRAEQESALREQAELRVRQLEEQLRRLSPRREQDGG